MDISFLILFRLVKRDRIRIEKGTAQLIRLFQVRIVIGLLQDLSYALSISVKRKIRAVYGRLIRQRIRSCDAVSQQAEGGEKQKRRDHKRLPVERNLFRELTSRKDPKPTPLSLPEPLQEWSQTGKKQEHAGNPDAYGNAHPAE